MLGCWVVWSEFTTGTKGATPETRARRFTDCRARAFLAARHRRAISTVTALTGCYLENLRLLTLESSLRTNWAVFARDDEDIDIS